MILPQLDFTFLSSQIFWLFLTAFITYWFNKRIFLPKLLANLGKRDKLLKDLQEKREKLELHIKTVELEITENFLRSQVEARAFLAQAAKEAQKFLQKEIQIINQTFTNRAEHYSLENSKRKEKLESNLQLVVDDIKIKVKNFITYNVE